MKLLLVWNSIHDYQNFLSNLDSYENENQDDFLLQINNISDQISRLHYIFFEGIHVYSLIGGYSSEESAFFTSRVLQLMRFNLVIQIGITYALQPSSKDQNIICVVKDKPWGFHSESDGDLFPIIYKGDWPQKMGGFVNMTNAYFNIFLEITKVASLTIPSFQLLKIPSVEEKIKSMKVHTLSTNGWGFHYSCLYFRQPFYQIRFTREFEKINQKEIFINEINQIIGLIKLIS